VPGDVRPAEGGEGARHGPGFVFGFVLADAHLSPVEQVLSALRRARKSASHFFVCGRAQLKITASAELAVLKDRHRALDSGEASMT